MSEVEALKAAIARRAREFDPVALLDALAYLGYRTEEILFQSNQSATSQPALIDSVEFRAQPLKHAVVTLNLGLLAPQTPLPSYFTKLLDDSELDEQAFVDFLRFFDHRLLEGFLNAIYPERDPSVFRDWEGTKRSYVKLLGLRSHATMHWLFEVAFPELGVQVDRGTLKRNVKLEGAELGVSILGGGAVLGGWTKAPVPGFVVTLFCDEEHTEFGLPWAEEVRRRLDSIVFPALAEAALELKVSLVIRSEKVWAQLRPGSYLGFDRIKGGARRNREVQVFKGTVEPTTRASQATFAHGAKPRVAPPAGGRSVPREPARPAARTESVPS